MWQQKNGEPLTSGILLKTGGGLYKATCFHISNALFNYLSPKILNLLKIIVWCNREQVFAFFLQENNVYLTKSKWLMFTVTVKNGQWICKR